MLEACIGGDELEAVPLAPDVGRLGLVAVKENNTWGEAKIINTQKSSNDILNTAALTLCTLYDYFARNVGSGGHRVSFRHVQ